VDAVDQGRVGDQVVEHIVHAPSAEQVEDDLVRALAPGGLDLMQLALEFVEASDEGLEPCAQELDLVHGQDGTEA
jgi:hypothetical protein